jgi:thiol-disulfide isomerase/thioredoxin
LAALLSLFLLPGASAAPQAAVSVRLLDGGGLSLDEYRGDKPLLLKFWASWCGVCLEQMPAYNDLHARYGDRVQFLSVNAAINDPLEQARATVEKHELKMPVAYDESGQLWDRFDVIATPMYVLLDRGGAVVFAHYLHDENLEHALEAAIASRAPESAGLEPDRAPRTPTDIDGQPFDLEADDNETLVVYHFATWCETYLRETDPERIPRCREFRESIDRLAARNLPLLRIIGFATSNGIDAESVRQYREQHGIDHQLVYDRAETFAARFGVRDFPYLVVVRDGAVVHSSDRLDPALLRDLASR